MALSLDYLMSIYRALKAHDNAIMSERPEGMPHAQWRMDHPAPVASSFRVYDHAGKQRWATVNHDTVPVLVIYSMAAKPALIERIDLRSPADALDRYSLPAPGDMANFEFAAIRKKLGLTQVQMAGVLDYANAINVSAMERETNPRAIPTHIARLMRAYEDGYRPADWPA